MNQIDNFVYVDASSTPNPGPTEYRGLYKGAIIFSKHIGHSSNNVGEFLAIVHALSSFEHIENKPSGIYSDSKIAIKWVKSGRVQTMFHSILVDRAEAWLKANKNRIPILWWNKSAQGKENPADYNRKGKYVSKEPSLETLERQTSKKAKTCLREFLDSKGLFSEWKDWQNNWNKNINQ